MKIVDRLKQIFRGTRKPICFTGDFKSWDDAETKSTGYAAPEILEKTRVALLKVKAGEAAFERDSVLFQKPDYPFPIIAAMLREAVASDGRLSVLDFGGSLGSSYFQCRSFFKALRSLRWHVIEQAAQVACGRRDFESEELRFHETIGECLSIEPDPNVLLLSGVLPYLEDPYQELENLLSYNIPTVIVDRTAFLAGDRDRLTVEQVPADIYDASYPFWFLSETKFHQTIGKKYRTIATFTPVDASLLARASGYFRGFILERTLG
jgi:putative methyltransferase (TIGR04325 family)